MASTYPVRYRSPALSSRASRQAGRQIERARQRSAVAVARGTLKTHAISQVAKSAVMDQSEVGMVAAAMVQRTPWPDFYEEARSITGASAVAMVGVVFETAREI
jgi:hypothetical protein